MSSCSTEEDTGTTKGLKMSNYTTIVIRMPDDSAGRAKIQQALEFLKPYQSGMSLEDEMTILEMIEQHEDFPDHIGQEARSKTAQLHAQAEIVA